MSKKTEPDIHATLQQILERLGRLEERVSLSKDIEQAEIRLRGERLQMASAAMAAVREPLGKPPEPRLRVHISPAFASKIESPQERIAGEYVTRFSFEYSAIAHYDFTIGRETTEYALYPTVAEWEKTLEIPTVADAVTKGRLIVRELTAEECARHELYNPPHNPIRDSINAGASAAGGRFR